MREYIGDFGHLMIIIAFSSTLVSAFSFFQSIRKKDRVAITWGILAKRFFLIHSFSLIFSILALYVIIFNHYYEYYYAWQHASNQLSTEFLISCLWEGQEGSFLLWMFWQMLLAWVVIKCLKKKSYPTLFFISLVQLILLSMVLGVTFMGTKIGSNAFLFFSQAEDLPIFQSNPDYIPLDGKGLNPLLQNYWMVIHPPVLFLGFALTLIPFSIAMGSLLMRKNDGWIKTALPWTILATCILGIGIFMGAYWAYETLNFGGYWSWDPVENAVYIPWLLLIASIHILFLEKKEQKNSWLSYIFVISSFLLVLYATFLTRSGILGNSSVHSFTDLGLTKQLSFLLLFFLSLAIFLLIRNRKALQMTKTVSIHIFNKSFWIYLGTSTLFLAAFQVLFHTSIPLYNVFFELFSLDIKMAPSTEPAVFYSQWQLFFALFITFFSATGHIFWWKKVSKENILQVLAPTLFITLFIATILIIFFPLDDWKYILLVSGAVYTLVSNISLFLFLIKKNYRFIGGALSHIGFGICILGIVFSSGYKKTLSKNRSGFIYNEDFDDEVNQQNLLLFREKEEKMEENTLIYKGSYFSLAQKDILLPKDDLFITEDPFIRLAKKDIYYQEEKIFSMGDSISILPENVYYRIDYYEKDSTYLSIFPRVQFNQDMGIVPSPSIKHYFNKDIYTHVTAIVQWEKDPWSEIETLEISKGDTFFINDYVGILKNISFREKVVGVDLNQNDVAIEANIKILDKNKNHYLKPLYIIKENKVGNLAEINDELGVKILFTDIKPKEEKFSFALQTRQKDWVIIKSIEMPYIGLVWLGGLIMFVGMGFAFFRRWYPKGLEE